MNNFKTPDLYINGKQFSFTKLFNDLDVLSLLSVKDASLIFNRSERRIINASYEMGVPILEIRCSLSPAEPDKKNKFLLADVFQKEFLQSIQAGPEKKVKTKKLIGISKLNSFSHRSIAQKIILTSNKSVYFTDKLGLDNKDYLMSALFAVMINLIIYEQVNIAKNQSYIKVFNSYDWETFKTGAQLQSNLPDTLRLLSVAFSTLISELKIQNTKELASLMIEKCSPAYKPVYFTLDELTDIYSEPVSKILEMIQSQKNS